MTIRFKPYHRGEPDSRDVPDFYRDDGYAFTCPQCDDSYIHVIDARTVEGPYDGRLTVEIAIECEDANGLCGENNRSTLIFGNFKGEGYAFWTSGAEWTDEGLGMSYPEK